MGPSAVPFRRQSHGNESFYCLHASIVTGLLSSSCCAIQLVLNIFSISCAGFSVLDRYRPIFLFLALIVNIASIWKQGFTRPSFTTFFVAALLSASPELVKLHNEGTLNSMLKGRAAADQVIVFELDIVGLSCQACANRLKLHIEKHHGVVGCDVLLKEMKAVVRCRPGTFQSEAELEDLMLLAGTSRAKVVQQYRLTETRDAIVEIELSKGGSQE